MPWRQVFDHLSPVGKLQFLTPRRGWVLYTFEAECDARSWKLSSFGSTRDTYIFELKFATTITTPPTCTDSQQLQYSMETPCLPVALPARVQGWCTMHQKAPITTSAQWKSGAKPTDIHQVMSLPNVLTGPDATEVPPCASEFAVELTPDNMFRHSVRVASCPHHRHAELCWPLVSCSSFMPSVTKHTCKPNSL